jgi:hypothetical protein
MRFAHLRADSRLPAAQIVLAPVLLLVVPLLFVFRCAAAFRQPRWLCTDFARRPSAVLSHRVQHRSSALWANPTGCLPVARALLFLWTMLMLWLVCEAALLGVPAGQQPGARAPFLAGGSGSERAAGGPTMGQRGGEMGQ